MGPAATCAGTPSVTNFGTACADVRAHRARETAPGWVDAALGPASNPGSLVAPDAPVQRRFRVKVRKVHFRSPAPVNIRSATAGSPLGAYSSRSKVSRGSLLENSLAGTATTPARAQFPR